MRRLGPAHRFCAVYVVCIHGHARPRVGKVQQRTCLSAAINRNGRCACLHMHRCRLQMINVPETPDPNALSWRCRPLVLYSCVHWSTDKVLTSFERTVWLRVATSPACASPVQNLRFQFFPRFAGFAGTTDSRERYLKGSPGTARARSKPAGPKAGTIVSGEAPSIQSVSHTLFHSRRAARSPAASPDAHSGAGSSLGTR